MFGDLWVVFVALELVVGADMGIAVGEVGNQPYSHCVVFQVIEKATALGLALVQGPAGRVYYQPGLVLLLGHFPQLFNAQSVVLGFLSCIQLVFCDQLFTQVAAAALGEKGVFGAQLHPLHIGAFLLALAVDTHITGGNTQHFAIITVEHFGGGKAGENLNPQVFCLGCQPATELAQADYIVAMVMHGFGRQQIGNFDAFAFTGKDKDIVTAHRG